MALYDAMNNGKPHPCAFAPLFRGKKGLENPLPGLWYNALARIAHTHLQVAARLQIRVGRGKMGIDIHICQIYPDPSAALPYGMGRIGAKIHQYLVDLRRIGHHEPRGILVNALGDFNRWRQ